MQKLIIICGPTATGKTSLALSLAKKFDGELISADSRQVYRGLDALTGKDRSEHIPIWLYDVLEAGDEFSAAHFVTLARRAIGNIEERKKLPIVVGGTGFYLRALTRAFDTITIPPNLALRRRLVLMSINKLQEILQQRDPDRWEHMNDSDRKNPRRLIRAIEVEKSTKIIRQKEPSCDTLWIGLTTSLPVLKDRIESRIKTRLNASVAEVRKDLPSILGVRPLLALVQGKIIQDEALRQWVNAEYQYAKRQLTWFKKEKDIHWFDVSDSDAHAQIIDMVQSWYTH